MTVKKLLLLIPVVLTLGFFLHAEKKDPPLPLQELQNPKGPSYVPIPYPETREEIITDLKYIIKKLYTPRKNSPSYGYISRGDKLLPGLLEDDPGVYIGKIVDVTNKTTYRVKKFIVIDIHDKSGDVIARVGLEDSGLFATALFPAENFSKYPLMSIAEVKKFFVSSNISRLNKSNIESIEYEVYKYGRVVSPVLKIKTPDKIFYMDSRHSIFEIMEKGEFSSLRSFVSAHSRIYYSADDKDISNRIFLVDNHNNRFMRLQKVQ
ncbi:MAG: hypothetical protein KAW12_19825 [Candidatus Aminicenantes bacterium]|nr:hypothetical protein [Candidatus Aminicenantes bacterium]